jgi:hypothetical protein
MNLSTRELVKMTFLANTLKINHHKSRELLNFPIMSLKIKNLKLSTNLTPEILISQAPISCLARRLIQIVKEAKRLPLAAMTEPAEMKIFKVTLPTPEIEATTTEAKALKEEAMNQGTLPSSGTWRVLPRTSGTPDRA